MVGARTGLSIHHFFSHTPLRKGAGPSGPPDTTQLYQRSVSSSSGKLKKKRANARPILPNLNDKTIFQTLMAEFSRYWRFFFCCCCCFTKTTLEHLIATRQGNSVSTVLLLPEMLIQSWNKHPNSSSLWYPLLRVTLESFLHDSTDETLHFKSMGNNLDSLLCIDTSANYNKKVVWNEDLFTIDIQTKDKPWLWKLRML